MARILASIDLGGTNTACALASADGAMLVERTIPTLPNQCPDAILGRIVATLEAMAEEIGERTAANFYNFFKISETDESKVPAHSG